MGIHDRQHVEIESYDHLRHWLSENHASSPGVWVVTYKKSTGKPAPTYDEIVRAALCWGWIDSISGKVDDYQTKLYLSPRKHTSAWSLSNKTRVDELIASGEMTEHGFNKVEAAKASGRWNLIDSAQQAEIPDDLQAAFELHPGSAENFEAFPRGVRKQILEWITQAKTPETREKRILETAAEAQKNIRANQWRDKKNAREKAASDGATS